MEQQKRANHKQANAQHELNSESSTRARAQILRTAVYDSTRMFND